MKVELGRILTFEILYSKKRVPMRVCICISQISCTTGIHWVLAVPLVEWETWEKKWSKSRDWLGSQEDTYKAIREQRRFKKSIASWRTSDGQCHKRVGEGEINMHWTAPQSLFQWCQHGRDSGKTGGNGRSSRGSRVQIRGSGVRQAWV